MNIRFIRLVAILLFFPFIMANGQDDDFRYIEVNGIRYKVLKEPDDASTFGTVSVCPAEYGEYSGEIIVPLTVKEFDDAYTDVFKVVAIEDFAFRNSRLVTSVKLPVSIESIGKAAFQGCKAASIDIPLGNLTKIGARAFSGSKIKTVNIPSGVKSLGVAVFSGCSELETASLGENLRSIPDSTFYQCSSLRRIIIPKRVSRIGDCAFLGCVDLRSVQLNESLRSIGPRAFAYCKSLTCLSLPESLCEIGWGAFIDTGLFEISIPSNVKTLHKYVFAESSIRKIHLNDGLERIESGCFLGTDTYKIEIPQNTTCERGALLRNNGNYDQSEKVAFDNQIRGSIKKAKSIVTVDDVSVFGVMDYSASLLSQYPYFNPPEMWIYAGGNVYSVIYCPEPGVEYGQLRLLYWDNGQAGNIRVPDIIVYSDNKEEKKFVVTSLGWGVFDKNRFKHVLADDFRENVNSLQSITSIETGCFLKHSYKAPFDGCTAKHIKLAFPLFLPHLYRGSAIEKYEFPKGIEEIPESFFENCQNLKTITVPSTVKRIGKKAFSNASITMIIIPEGVEIIGDEAFSQCQNLKEVTLPSTLKEICNSAFSKCVNLSSINLPSSLQKIKYAAFSGCTSLKTITLPSSLDELDNAFSKCGFDSFVVPANFNEICSGYMEYFEGCTNLKTIEFAPGTKIIPQNMCCNLSSLEIIILPNTLEEIGRGAFMNTSLKSVSIPESVKKIDRDAFNNCPIECVVIPSSVKDLGAFSFSGAKKIQLKCNPRLLTRALNVVDEECIVEVLE